MREDLRFRARVFRTGRGQSARVGAAGGRAPGWRGWRERRTSPTSSHARAGDVVIKWGMYGWGVAVV
eukprot:1552414-Prymnesium_polylepis.1